MANILNFRSDFPIADPETGLITPEFLRFLFDKDNGIIEIDTLAEEALNAANSAQTTADNAQSEVDALETVVANLELDDLTDVDTTSSSPNDGDVLTYDNSAGLWVPEAPSGGGGGSWSVVATWTYSSSVTTIPFTGLAGYSDFLVITKNITFSSNSAASVRVSTNNGSSYYSTSGDYLAVAATGSTTNSTHMGNAASTLHTAARDGFVEIIGNTGSSPPISRSSSQQEAFREFVASAAPINALQVFSNAGSNFTGGTIYVLAR